MALRNEGNVKDLVKVRTRNIPKITSIMGIPPGACRRSGARRGQELHAQPRLVGADSEQTVAPALPLLFTIFGSPPRLHHGIPDYMLKVVKPEVMKMIEKRCEASRDRLPAAFPGGETLRTTN